MKHFFISLLCFFNLSCLSRCDTFKQNKIIDENFYCKLINGTIYIGNVKTYPSDGAVFFPEKIGEYTVTNIGYPSGNGFGGNGYLYSNKTGEKFIERCYFPHTIQYVKSDYMKYKGDYKIFYCGSVVDAGFFGCYDIYREVYVPAEKFEEFKKVTDSEHPYCVLLKANVAYKLNYDESNYYYVDYYEGGEKIEYVPPIPQRDGYIFEGWFKESDCVNPWDFESDVLPVSSDETFLETILYAKWEKK